MPTFISVTEAARELGIRRQSVLKLINRKTISAFKVGRQYLINRGSWEQYKEVRADRMASRDAAGGGDDGR